jgi:hypothetical protein
VARIPAGVQPVSRFKLRNYAPTYALLLAQDRKQVCDNPPHIRKVMQEVFGPSDFR